MKKFLSFYTLPYKLVNENDFDFDFGFWKSLAIVLFLFILQSAICFWTYSFFPAASNVFSAIVLILFQLFICLPLMSISLVYIFGNRIPVIKKNTFSFKMVFICILLVISIRLLYPLLFFTTDFLINNIPEINSLPTLKNIFFDNNLYNTYEFYYFLSAVFYAPFIEELLFRGIIFRGLSKRYSPGTAIFLSSLLFGIAHISPLQSLHAFVLGALSACIYYKTDCIYYCILFHLISNAIVTLSTILLAPSLLINIVCFIVGLPIFIFTIIKLIRYNMT